MVCENRKSLAIIYIMTTTSLIPYGEFRHSGNYSVYNSLTDYIGR